MKISLPTPYSPLTTPYFLDRAYPILRVPPVSVAETLKYIKYY
ncbi:MAG TPA: hypothetical protein V6D35_05925 [Candidatus Sericytochromatia bacterium]